MTDNQNQPIKPTNGGRRCWVSLCLTVLVTGGLAGLLAATFRCKEGSTLRGKGTTLAGCPEHIEFLDQNGMVQQDFSELSAELASPSCSDKKDPVQGRYFDWSVPSDGQAKLSSWTILVDSSSCECITSESTFDVKQGHHIRVWTPVDEVQPIQFTQNENGTDGCPRNVPLLDAEGKVLDSVDRPVLSNAPPSCANQDDPTQGLYFEWEAPQDGMVTLSAWTLLVDACSCVTAMSTFGVTQGQRIRVWTPTDQNHPLQFNPN